MNTYEGYEKMTHDQVISYVEENLNASTTVYFKYLKPGEASPSDREVTLMPPESVTDKRYKPGENFYGIDLVDGQVKLWRFDRIVAFSRELPPLSAAARQRRLEVLREELRKGEESTVATDYSLKGILDRVKAAFGNK